MCLGRMSGDVRLKQGRGRTDSKMWSCRLTSPCCTMAKAKKDIVVAIMSGSLVVGLLLKASMFSKAKLVLGGGIIERAVGEFIAHQAGHT